MSKKKNAPRNAGTSAPAGEKAPIEALPSRIKDRIVDQMRELEDRTGPLLYSGAPTCRGSVSGRLAFCMATLMGGQ
jgi:hypothetical protein